MKVGVLKFIFSNSLKKFSFHLLFCCKQFQSRKIFWHNFQKVSANEFMFHIAKLVFISDKSLLFELPTTPNRIPATPKLFLYF